MTGEFIGQFEDLLIVTRLPRLDVNIEVPTGKGKICSRPMRQLVFRLELELFLEHTVNAHLRQVAVGADIDIEFDTAGCKSLTDHGQHSSFPEMDFVGQQASGRNDFSFQPILPG